VPRWRTTLLSLTVLAACGTDQLVDGHFSAQEWAYLQTFRRPAPEPCPPSLAIAPERCDDAARLGQRLFFDRSYAGPLLIGDDGQNGGLGEAGEEGRVACSDCHVPDAWFADNRSRPGATSLGAGWTGRNTPTLVDIGDLRGAYTWDGTYPQLDDVLLAPLLKEALLNSSADRLAAAIRDQHRAAYDAAFDPDLPGGPLTADVIARVRDDAARAIEAYERRLISGPAPFDRYLDGDTAAIADDAKRGLALFVGPALCSECHGGPTFADGRYHATGVSQHRAGADHRHVPAVDRGRAGITGLAADEGRFRTPGLRHVAETAPYMHAGQIGTLAEVLDFYRWGGDPGGFAGVKDELMVPLELSDDDLRDLEAFLRTLTGEPVAAELRR
jgi:cytochrome c peroxidase